MRLPLVGLEEDKARNTKKDKNLLWKENLCIWGLRTTSRWSASRIQKHQKGDPSGGPVLFPSPGSFFNENMLSSYLLFLPNRLPPRIVLCCVVWRRQSCLLSRDSSRLFLALAKDSRVSRKEPLSRHLCQCYQHLGKPYDLNRTFRVRGLPIAYFLWEAFHMRKFILVAMAALTTLPIGLSAAALTLRDGNVVYGQFVSGTSQTIVFDDSNGVRRRFDVDRILNIDFSPSNAPIANASPREYQQPVNRPPIYDSNTANRIDDRNDGDWARIPRGTEIEVRTDESINSRNPPKGEPIPRQSLTT